MSFNFDGSTVNVTGSVTSTSPAIPDGATIVAEAIGSYTNTGTTIYTVPAGKTFYCKKVGFVFNYGGAGNEASLRDDGTIVFTALPNYAGENAVREYSFDEPIVFAENSVVSVIDSTAGGGGRGAMVWGWIL